MTLCLGVLIASSLACLAEGAVVELGSSSSPTPRMSVRPLFVGVRTGKAPGSRILSSIWPRATPTITFEELSHIAISIRRTSLAAVGRISGARAIVSLSASGAAAKSTSSPKSTVAAWPSDEAGTYATLERVGDREVVRLFREGRRPGPRLALNENQVPIGWIGPNRLAVLEDDLQSMCAYDLTFNRVQRKTPFAGGMIVGVAPSPDGRMILIKGQRANGSGYSAILSSGGGVLGTSADQLVGEAFWSSDRRELVAQGQMALRSPDIPTDPNPEAGHWVGVYEVPSLRRSGVLIWSESPLGTSPPFVLLGRSPVDRAIFVWFREEHKGRTGVWRYDPRSPSWSKVFEPDPSTRNIILLWG